jgi:peptidoglycan hydrolase CwlO-like protein
MNVRRMGLISFIAIAFIMGCFLTAWSAAPAEDRESYKKEVQEKMKDLDKKIDELQAKASDVKGEAKEEFKKEMAVLHKKQKAAKKEWKKVEHASAKAWNKVKAAMDTAVQDVQGAYDKAASRLKDQKG